MTVSERVNYMDSIESQRDTRLFKVLEISEMTIRSIVEGGNPSYKTIVKILNAYPTLNARWLLLGEEPMYIHEKSYEKQEMQMSRVEESAVGYMRQSTLYNYPLLVREVEELRKIVEELRKSVAAQPPARVSTEGE